MEIDKRDKSYRNSLRRRVIISLLVIIAALFLGYLLLSLPFILPYFSSQQWLPAEGTWYCEELQIQFCVENENESFAMIDGIKIPCYIRNDRGSSVFSICAASPDFDDIVSVGEALFSGEYVDLNSDVFIVMDRDTKQQVVFRRVP